MDREQAIFILENQAQKHEAMCRTILIAGESIIAKQHETIADAMRYAAGKLREEANGETD